PCGLLPSRFSYRHSAWRARGYVPMSDGTRRDGQACASHPPPKTVRRVAGLGLTHTAVQQTVVDVNSGPEEPIASISPSGDRKSTRLNSSYVSISYAVFCF